MWTLKEAFTKCLGSGASFGFSRVDTSSGRPRLALTPTATVALDAFTFRQHTVEVGHGAHVLALVSAPLPSRAAAGPVPPELLAV
jgi:phosphopantetheinyl transferase